LPNFVTRGRRPGRSGDCLTDTVVRLNRFFLVYFRDQKKRNPKGGKHIPFQKKSLSLSLSWISSICVCVCVTPSLFLHEFFLVNDMGSVSFECVEEGLKGDVFVQASCRLRCESIYTKFASPCTKNGSSQCAPTFFLFPHYPRDISELV